MVADWQVETKYQHCCLNNAGRGFVNAAESIIMKAQNGYYVNSYLQARIRFEEASFRISAGYADNGTVSITVRGAKAGEKLYLRIPSWSKHTQILIGADTIADLTECGQYYMLPLSGENQLIRMVFDMAPEIIDFAGEFRPDLPDTDYHLQRWPDSNGLCGREQMVTHPMSVIRRGPLMLARSKRVGCSEAEMFNGETVWGRKRSVTAQTLRHDRLQTLCRVNITSENKEYEYLMCDYASAANKDLEEVRYFTMFV